MLRARAVADLADALDAELAERGGTALLRRPRAAAARRAGRPGGGAASRSTSSACTSWRRSSAARVQAAAQDAYDGDRQGDQPRLAQAAAGRAVRRARACRRPSAPRPATPPTPTRCRPVRDQTEHPFLAHLLEHRDATRLQVDRGGSAEDRRRRRPHPHHVQPDDRARPAGSPRPSRTCRTSRSAPRRAGASARSFVGRCRRLRRADDRGLQPDRDADHGAPVRGRRADRGVPVRRGLPRGHGGRRCSGSRRARGQPAPSAPRSRR